MYPCMGGHYLWSSANCVCDLTFIYRISATLATEPRNEGLVDLLLCCGLSLVSAPHPSPHTPFIPLSQPILPSWPGYMVCAVIRRQRIGFATQTGARYKLSESSLTPVEVRIQKAVLFTCHIDLHQGTICTIDSSSYFLEVRSSAECWFTRTKKEVVFRPLDE